MWGSGVTHPLWAVDHALRRKDLGILPLSCGQSYIGLAIKGVWGYSGGGLPEEKPTLGIV
jgi:hypothetical protein